MTRRPARWTRIVGVAAAAAGLLVLTLLLDRSFSTWVSTQSVRTSIEQVLNRLLGLGVYVFIVGILAAFPNRARLITGFLLTASVGGIVVQALKWLFGRVRPRGFGDGPVDPTRFLPMSGADNSDAFPSGHCLAIGIIAGLMATYFPRGRWLFYGLAGLIGIERVVTRWHYVSDVVAGFLLAAVVVLACRRMLGPSFFRVQSPGAAL
jgi:membrane-associated phospholipid phosphatase